MPKFPIVDDCNSGAEALARVMALRKRKLVHYGFGFVRPASAAPKVVKAPSQPPPPPKPQTTIILLYPPPLAMVDTGEEGFLERPRPFMRQIIDTTAKYFGMEAEEIRSHRRLYNLTLARHIVMYLCATMTTKSYPEIGRFIDHDHTTVLHGIRRINAMLEAGIGVVAEYIDEIKEGIAGRPMRSNVQIGRFSAHRAIFENTESMRIIELKAEGKTFAEIGILLGRSRQSIRSKAIELLSKQGGDNVQSHHQSV